MFSSQMQNAVTRTDHCYRAYMKLTTCEGKVLYIKSHSDVTTPESNTSTAEIASIGGTSQGLDLFSSQTTIGGLSFRILDFDGKFTEWLKSLRSCSLAGCTVQYYAGYIGVDTNQFHCVSTTIIDTLITKYKRYTFETRDITRLGRVDIFGENCVEVYGGLFDRDSLTVKPRSTGSRGQERAKWIYRELQQTSDDEFAPDNAPPNYGIIETLEQKTPFEIQKARHGEDSAIFVKTDGCEILKLQLLNKIDVGPITVDNGDDGLPSQGFQYAIIGRRQHQSAFGLVESTGEVIRDGSKLCQALILSGPAPWVIYAAMTGLDYDTGEQVLPSNSHANIDPKWVDRTCLSKKVIPQLWNEKLEFICPGKTDAKRWWESQVLDWIDAYARVTCDGKICITPHARPGDSAPDAREVDDKDIIRIEPLTEKYNYPTGIYISYDKDPCSDSYNAGIGSEKESGIESEDNCVPRKIEIKRYDGVRAGFTSYRQVSERSCRLLAVYGQPRWTTEVILCISYGDVLMGDQLKVSTSLLTDYHGDNTLKRTFTVIGVSTNFASGEVKVQLVAPTKYPSLNDLSVCSSSTSSCGEDYSEGRIPLPWNGLVAEGERKLLEAGNYYHEGDLVIDGIVRQVTRGTLNIAVSGVVSGKGQISTSAMGMPGQDAFNGLQTDNRTYIAGYGFTKSQGGVLVKPMDKWVPYDMCFSRFGSSCSGLNFGTFNFKKVADTLDMQLWGIGGCGGSGAHLGTGVRSTAYDIGGNGGDGGGGLILTAKGLDTSDLTIDTSGADGQAGKYAGIATRIVRGGAGAGGAAGRAILVLDGVPLNSVAEPSRFVLSERGVTPFDDTPANSFEHALCLGRIGSTNLDRSDGDIIRVVSLSC